jgi:hypothetical protein
MNWILFQWGGCNSCEAHYLLSGTQNAPFEDFQIITCPSPHKLVSESGLLLIRSYRKSRFPGVEWIQTMR